MNQLFHIKADTPAEENAMLLCEVGEQYLVAAEYNSEKKHINSLSYFTYESNEAEKAIRSILDQHAHLNSKAWISAAFPETVIIPDALFDATDLQKYFLTSVTDQQVLHDAVAEWKLNIAYKMPEVLHQIFKNSNKELSFLHAYTTELKVYNGYVVKDQISIHFIPQQFRVLVKKEGVVQLAQMYRYTSPLDVVYYLLKIMEAFELKKEDTFCLLSGLIQEDSSLYTELSNYFFNLQFANPAVSIPQNEYPRHFFTSILNLAVCVS